jgi:hypothetical protein
MPHWPVGRWSRPGMAVRSTELPERPVAEGRCHRLAIGSFECQLLLLPGPIPARDVGPRRRWGASPPELPRPTFYELHGCCFSQRLDS